MSKHRDQLPSRSSDADVENFLKRLADTPVARTAARGRLIFALDATASREPTWDMACSIQAEMFAAGAASASLDIQLCWYRGYGEFRAEPWSPDAASLQHKMGRVYCLGGATQIGRVLSHAASETRQKRVNALVFVGDCMEENADMLYQLAGELGLLGLPVFLFQEGHEPVAQGVFARIAKLSGGAHCRFDSGSARQLRELLAAVAAYASGGTMALEQRGPKDAGARLLLQQLKRD